MPVYPVFLELAGRPCVVVGAGAVGLRKVRGLREAGAHVTVIEPNPSPDLRALAARDADLAVVERAFEAGDTAGALLVYACTDRGEVNEAVAADASVSKALGCRADLGHGSDFMAGAVLRRGEVCVAVSTSGTRPGLARRLRDRIAASGLVDAPEGDNPAGGPCTR